MKKLVSLILSLSILFGVCSFAVSADEGITEYPVVIIPGVAAAELFLGDDPETGECVWHFSTDEIINRVLDRIAELGIGLGALTLGNAKVIAKTVGVEMADLFEEIACNDDGTSKYEISYYSSAAETSTAALKAKFEDNYMIVEKEFNEMFCGYVGEENVFNFFCDWRMGAESCATELDAYIQQVKEITGKEKVNLYAISHGGQIGATYLNLFGYKGDVDNACLTVPAIGGAGIAYDLAVRDVHLDEEGLIRFIEQGFNSEEDFEWLVKAQQLGFLDDVFNELVPYIMPVFRSWVTIWDFMPYNQYEEVKDILFADGKGKEILKKSDRYHYEIVPSMGEKLQACVDSGMNISILMGYGEKIVSGMEEHSDCIILTHGATGAKCAPLGKRFADGYVQVNDCGGKNKVSPGMDIDASTAYLPDNTWFIDGMFHGMMHPTEYSRTLVETLVISDKITDVYSDPAYPQFMASPSISQSVYAQFNNSVPGYISGDADALTVTNLGVASELTVVAITCDGINLDFDLSNAKNIAPGESVNVAIRGDIPEKSRAVANITVYFKTENLAPLNYRTLAFTIDNGDPVPNTNHGFVDAETTPFERDFDYRFVNFLEKLGLKEVAVLFYGIITSYIKILF